MFSQDRRQFLGTTFSGLAAAAWGASQFGSGSSAWGIEQGASPTATPSSLFLTWQGDPTTTMTIQWIAPEGMPGPSLRYRVEEEAEWMTAAVQLRPFPDTDLKVHRCELSGLKPGTEYVFEASSSTTGRFRTMPAKATNTIQFVSGGDAGIGEHAIRTNLLAAKQEPYFALIGGDLAYDNGRSPGTFLQFLQNYSQQMIDAKGRMIPLISCLGNHEVNGGYNGTRERAAHYLSVFEGFFRETTYGVLDIGDYLSLVLLDTDHLTPIAGEQTSWLRQTLADRQERPHLIVANHVPAYPSVRNPQGKDGKLGTGEGNRQHWCPLFERYNVDVVLEHHDHAFKRTHPLTDGRYDKNGVLYLGDGSWGKLRAPESPEKRPYLARVSEAYHLTVHRLEGEERFHVALEESGKVEDVCMTRSKRPARRG